MSDEINSVYPGELYAIAPHYLVDQTVGSAFEVLNGPHKDPKEAVALFKAERANRPGRDLTLIADFDLDGARLAHDANEKARKVRAALRADLDADLDAETV